MPRILFNVETDWDKALVRMLWRAWHERPASDCDATGASMMMDIQTQFVNALRGDERSGIPVLQPTESVPSVRDRSFVEVNIADYYGSKLHRLRLTVDQAQILQRMLNEHFEVPPKPLHQVPNQG